MDLTPEEQRILAGENGEAARIAMAVLLKLTKSACRNIVKNKKYYFSESKRR